MLVDVENVVEAYVSMGFAYRRLDGRRHWFFRHPAMLIHTSARGIGFVLDHLFLDAGIHGVGEELKEALMGIDDLRLYPLEAPSSQT